MSWSQCYKWSGALQNLFHFVKYSKPKLWIREFKRWHWYHQSEKTFIILKILQKYFCLGVHSCRGNTYKIMWVPKCQWKQGGVGYVRCLGGKEYTKWRKILIFVLLTMPGVFVHESWGRGEKSPTWGTTPAPVSLPPPWTGLYLSFSLN